MKFLILSLVFLISVSGIARAAKILGIFATPSRSHHFLGRRLMEGLGERGHQATLITSFAEKHVNYQQVILTGFYEKLHNDSMNFFEEFDLSTIDQTLYLSKWGANLTIDVLEHANFKKMISSNATFDVIITEQFFMEALKGLSWHYKAHLILFNTITSTTWLNNLIGNPSPSSYIPEPMLGYPPNMNFFQRLRNSIDRLSSDFIFNVLDYPEQNRIWQSYFPGYPDIRDIIHNTSLVLMNSDLSVGQPIPKVPNMIDIAGMHIKIGNELPQDLKNYLDRAKEGVVYFSMGSNLKSSLLPESTKKSLMRVFSKLKQKVLWKFEENLPDKPSNLEIRKWIPQQGVLGHPNIKLFISHGGLLSTIESVYFGLPMLAIPVFGDQKMNAIQTARNGLGLYIYYKNLTEKHFENCLKELLINKRYATKAKEASRIMHDKPMKPMDSAIYWIEYVIRHNGATHLRTASLELNFMQYFLLDVIFLFISLSVSLILILKYISFKCNDTKSTKLKKH